MLPIGDVNPTRHRPYVTLAFIALNLAAFLLWQPTFAGQAKQQTFFFCHAEIPYEVSHQTNLARGGAEAVAAIAEDLELAPQGAQGLQQFLQLRCPDKSWSLSIFVAMFLHGGWMHIAGNMLYLWVFGNNVEDRLRPIGFVVFYLLGGITASGLQLAFDENSAIPSLGASGAIAAVLGAYLVMFPRARVRALTTFFVISIIELPAVFVLGGWFVLQLFQGVGELGGGAVNTGVAYWAHIGGFIAGVVGGLLLRNRRPPHEWTPPRPDYP
ncbi:MAG TPA: rhomboid family intramembrane serine protease [Actinomycetota bacterium]|nr:rhomboid family intramembrane serine protease [Actinomycetota bacterium]